jgi:LysM repeat protein
VALVVTAVALVAVLSSSSGKSTSPSGSGGAKPAKTKPAATKAKTTSRTKARRYTVKTGDTPSSIAESTGVPLDKLLELNPDVDPQALSPGQRLKLGP